ncbi:hypothetical protein GCM10022251_68220 [Phytohabitans flavus]|uniref:DUF1211 domain-containing membrane protein n=1 Tax=Phytohabitans flavus TaxID=1076124 RepID=A0A6F8XQQ6_9ACTN|nr:TMEM175 family protein [Phytohabitans flavus]BCB76150.1 hypothetical protein Pflav_025600 [Phytohabitans flavus]
MANGEPGGLRPDTGRAEAFSDGVLAIVITLLVLNLRVPVTEPGDLREGLLDQWPAYVAYVASFGNVAVVWLNHRAAFARLRRSSRGLQWANLFVLFTTVLLPFPTAVVSRALQDENLTDQRTAVVLYALANILLSVSWAMFFQYLMRHPEISAEEVETPFFRGERLRSLVGVVLYAVGALIGYLVEPLLALAFFVALPIFYGVTSTGLYSLRRVTRRFGR